MFEAVPKLSFECQVLQEANRVATLYTLFGYRDPSTTSGTAV